MPLIRKLVPILAALALLAVPTAATAAAPPGFVGISPQSAPSEPDFELMERAGLRSVRLPLFWSSVEPVDPSSGEADWEAFDHAVELAARHDMRVMPFVWGTPPWLSPTLGSEPVDSARERHAWTSFLRRAVRRYGANGSFWREQEEEELEERQAREEREAQEQREGSEGKPAASPEAPGADEPVQEPLPYLPIRRWEIWNEQNIVTFGDADPERFARLIRISGRVLRRADPAAKLILGGFFGRPLQVPPNVHAGAFLSELYRARRIKRWFDGVALHPYVARARAMRAQILNLRRVMRVHNDAATPLYVTELGWGSDSYESRWERGLWGQARELDRAFAMLSANRRAWRIGGVWWFSWADARHACQFCDSAGLLTEAREAKPSWYVFNEWTGGDAETVPRAAFDD